MKITAVPIRWDEGRHQELIKLYGPERLTESLVDRLKDHELERDQLDTIMTLRIGSIIGKSGAYEYPAALRRERGSN